MNYALRLRRIVRAIVVVTSAISTARRSDPGIATLGSVSIIPVLGGVGVVPVVQPS